MNTIGMRDTSVHVARRHQNPVQAHAAEAWRRLRLALDADARRALHIIGAFSVTLIGIALIFALYIMAQID